MPAQLTELNSLWTSLDEDRTAVAYALHREAETLRGDGELRLQTVIDATSDFQARAELLQSKLTDLATTTDGEPATFSASCLASLADCRRRLEWLGQCQPVRETLDRATRLASLGAPVDLAPVSRAMQVIAEQLAFNEQGEDFPAELSENRLGEHPLSRLLALVRDGESLANDEWQCCLDSVRDAFGPEIAAAAARGRLTLSPSSDAPA